MSTQYSVRTCWLPNVLYVFTKYPFHYPVRSLWVPSILCVLARNQVYCVYSQTTQYSVDTHWVPSILCVLTKYPVSLVYLCYTQNITFLSSSHLSAKPSINQYASYRCIARGYPIPIADWWYSGAPLSPHLLKGTYRITKRIMDGKIDTVLTIKLTSVVSDEEVKCNAKNTVGTDSRAVTITVKGIE